MAIENHAILNGEIKKIKAAKDRTTGEIQQIHISLMVLRRPNASIGNKRGQLRFDDVPILVRDKDQIKYVLDHKLTEGDMLEVSGVFNTQHGTKHFFCSACHEENFYDGTIAYVTPLCIEYKEIHPKQIEIVRLTEEECSGSKEEILKTINSKKLLPGRVINTEPVRQNDYGTDIKVTIQEETTNDEAVEWMKNMSDISNRIYIMGNLCADPVYMVNESGGRTSTYQLGINRKVYVKEDDPSVRADYPFIKSINDQADSDHKALMQGSLVFIEGAIQSRDGFIVEKQCAHCGETCKVNGNTLEIVPYAVEYLRNCITDTDDNGFEEDENSEENDE